jgi:hypothetical protein
VSDGDSTATVEYRTIDRYPGHRFGADGSIWSCWKRGYQCSSLSDEWKRLREHLRPDGYLNVSMREGRGLHRHRFAHRLIAEAFHGPPGMECRHKNNQKTDNRSENVIWGTPVENQFDRIANGTSTRGEGHGLSKLTDESVIQIRLSRAAGASLKALAEEFGVTFSNVSAIVLGKSWRHILPVDFAPPLDGRRRGSHRWPSK